VSFCEDKWNTKSNSEREEGCQYQSHSQHITTTMNSNNVFGGYVGEGEGYQQQEQQQQQVRGGVNGAPYRWF
jgi:hypothetical protein